MTIHSDPNHIPMLPSRRYTDASGAEWTVEQTGASGGGSMVADGASKVGFTRATLRFSRHGHSKIRLAVDVPLAWHDDDILRRAFEAAREIDLAT